MAQVFGIAFAQFFGCTLWFSVNGVSSALIETLGSLEASDIGLGSRERCRRALSQALFGLAIYQISLTVSVHHSIFLWASLVGSIGEPSVIRLPSERI